MVLLVPSLDLAHLLCPLGLCFLCALWGACQPQWTTTLVLQPFLPHFPVWGVHALHAPHWEQANPIRELVAL